MLGAFAMTNTLFPKHTAPIAALLGFVFAMFSLDYFEGYMAKAGVLAACTLWGILTGAAIGRSIPTA
jgi:hypothetical protein